MPDTSPARKRLRGQIANATRYGDHRLADDLRRDLKATNAEEYIQELVRSAPPLTREQRERLAGLLLPPRSARKTKP